jgi:spore coat protein U-like protein
MKTSNAKFLNKLALITAVAVAAGTGVSAQAGTQTATMELTTEVVANCTISAAALNVSGYDPIEANKTIDFDQTGSVTVACTKGTSAEVTFNDGLNVGRQLKNTNTTDLLDYELYSAAAGETVWGSTQGTGKGITGTGANVIYNVFMRVLPGQTNIPAGTYTDTVTATVTF